MSAAPAQAGIGHNLPPEEDRLMIDKLMADHDDILMMYESTLRKADEMPSAIASDEDAGKVSDYQKKLKMSKKMLDAAREAEKAPHLQKAGIIQNFFKSRMEKIDAVIKQIDEPLAKYLKQKEDDARRAREEKARLDKEEADRKLREAQEAERVAREEKAAAEREAQRLREVAEKEKRDREVEAERVRKAAEEEAARVKKAADEEAERKRKAAEEEQRIAAARIARLEEEKAELQKKNDAAVLQAEEDRKAAAQREKEIDAEKKRIEREAAESAKQAEKDAAAEVRRAEKEAAEKLTEANREARGLEREGRAAERAADAEISSLNKDVREFDRDAAKTMDEAVRADKVATKSEKATMEKGSVLSRTRGETSLSSVTERYVGTPRSREELFQSAALLWDHIPFSALEQAVQSAVNAGIHDIPGAIVVQETKTINR